MAERKLYVWRLEIEYPYNKPGYPPTHDVYGMPIDEPDDFWNAGYRSSEGEWWHWPRNRLYLSLAGAQRRAALFERYGCRVMICRSQVLEFGELEDTPTERGQADLTRILSVPFLEVAAKVLEDTAC